MITQCLKRRLGRLIMTGGAFLTNLGKRLLGWREDTGVEERLLELQGGAGAQERKRMRGAD